MRKIDLIVLHCSATRTDRCYTEYDLITDHLRRGGSGAGYHYYIRKDGSIKSLRPVDKSGAHARGYNAHSIGMKAGWTQMVIPVILELPFRNIPCVSW